MTTIQSLVDSARRYAQMFHDGQTTEGVAVAREVALERFMDTIFALGLALRVAQEHPTPQELPAAFQSIGTLLKPYGHWLKSYVNDTQRLFSTATDGGEWIAMSRRRSALAFLRDLSAGTAFEMVINTLDVNPIDDMIYEIGDTEGYLPADKVPSGVPEEHWWWWYPDPPPG